MGRKKISQMPARHTVQQTRDRSIPATTGDNSKPGQDDQWLQDMAVLRRAAQDRIQKRVSAKVSLPLVPGHASINPFAESLEYSSGEKQEAIVRSFYEHNPDQAASLLNVVLRESSPGQRRRIGSALVSSGLVAEAINNLSSEKNKDPYRAFSLLFLAAKAGQIHPLVEVIETHKSLELRLKLIGLLVSSGERESLNALRRLAASELLPVDVHAAIVKAIDQLNAQARESAPSAA